MCTAAGSSTAPAVAAVRCESAATTNRQAKTHKNARRKQTGVRLQRTAGIEPPFSRLWLGGTVGTKARSLRC